MFKSAEEKRNEEIQRLNAQEQKLTSDLEFQKRKTEVANKRQQISKMAQERRKNTPMGKVFTKIGSAITAPSQQGVPKMGFRDPFANVSGIQNVSPVQKQKKYVKKKINGKTVYVEKNDSNTGNPPPQTSGMNPNAIKW